ncbi:hypothetical protein ACFL1X_03325 [Candidatus Hydrogenedentota bacterium]
MAFGDVGGAVTELVVTFETKASGTVDIMKGEAVNLVGNYTVDNDSDAEDGLLGQALADSSANDEKVPVKLRGICVFAYTDTAPTVDGVAGVVCSATAGKVKAPASGNGHGVNLLVDTTNTLVHVLL